MANAIRMPQLGLTMETGLVAQWLKQEGDEVKAGEAILEIETDKLASEIISEVDGVLLKIVVQEGEDAAVKSVLGYVGRLGEEITDEMVEETEQAPVTEVAAETVSPVQQEEQRVPASPYAKKMAEALNVDYRTVPGAGPNGRVVYEDVRKAADKKQEQIPQPEQASTRMSGMRKTISERMLSSHLEIPSVTQTIKVDVTDLMEMRRILNEKQNTKISINDLILKATARTLRDFPVMLGQLNGNEIIHNILLLSAFPLHF